MNVSNVSIMAMCDATATVGCGWRRQDEGFPMHYPALTESYYIEI